MAEENKEEAEEQIVRGLLGPFDIDGKAHWVPELKWRANREWKTALQARFASLMSVPTDTPEGQQSMADAEREMVLSYDATHALGDLEDATERDIDAIYDEMVKVAFPLAESQTAMLMAIIRAAVESASPSSTSGPSKSGTTGAPTILRPRSPNARSPSSTRRRRSA